MSLRVVVIDPSADRAGRLTTALEGDGDIVVASKVADPSSGGDVVARLRPDVVTLDLRPPVEAALTTVEQVMGFTPTPILVLSDPSSFADSTAAVEALARGAVEVLPWPQTWDSVAAATLRSRVRVLRGVTVVRHTRGRRPETTDRTAGAAVVAMAASTGGPAALATVLSDLGGLDAPVLLVQHLHSQFIDAFVAWMTRSSALPVELARDGGSALPGVVYVAPADVHLKLGRRGRIVLDAEPASLHRPSADEMFASVAACAGPAAVGVVLTGIGDDGAAGMLELRRRGGTTIAQDAATAAVFGMPRAAQRIGAVDVLLPVDEIGRAIRRAVAKVPA